MFIKKDREQKSVHPPGTVHAQVWGKSRNDRMYQV